jgi:hypothetical protein
VHGARDGTRVDTFDAVGAIRCVLKGYCGTFESAQVPSQYVIKRLRHEVQIVASKLSDEHEAFLDSLLGMQAIVTVVVRSIGHCIDSTSVVCV